MLVHNEHKQWVVLRIFANQTAYSVAASAPNPRGVQIIYNPAFSQHTRLLEQFYM